MKLHIPRKYFFGYLFVRIAKALAIVILGLGIVYSLLKYAQAMNAADAVRYRSSVALNQRLDRLKASFSRTQHLVAAFNSAADNTQLPAPQLDGAPDSDKRFDRLGEQLGKIDQQRQRMKQLVIARFDTLVNQIEEKLRAHAASLRESATPPPTISATPIPTPTLTPSAAPQREEQETLFSTRLSKSEVDYRSATLDQTKNYLTTLEGKAENLESRKSLFDSITELESLKRLLPSRSEPPTDLRPTPTPAANTQPSPGIAPDVRSLAKAEEVANQLRDYRKSVRETMLSSWALDEPFDEASALVGNERNKCRSSSLQVNGIWLGSIGQIAMSVVAAVFLAFSILVLADLTSTLLDTATNTGIMADALPKEPQSPG